MEIDLKAAGRRIQAIRSQHKYSMALFANLVGNTSASTVNNWEKGNNLPKQERLEKIAILGNTTADWIRYGDFPDYVKKLLNKANLKKKPDDEQFEQLINLLKKQKISYSQDLKILTIANELFPSLFEAKYQLTSSGLNTALIAEDLTAYNIEHDNRYRNDLLPMIEGLLHNSDKKETNASVLFIVLDMLERCETSKNFSSTPQVFTLLSEILTKDLLFSNKSTSKIVNYTDFTKKRNNGEPLSENLVEKKYEQTKKELARLLDKFYAEYNKN